MLLRPRQEAFVERCVAALDAHGNTLGVAPTGAGKTVMLSAVAGRLAERGAQTRTLILQHRDELVEQNRRTYHAINGQRVASGVINAERKDFLRPVLFAMVQTLSRDANLEALRPADLVIVDEAHHTAAGSYRKIIDHVVRINPAAKLMGVTATPNRGDKKALRGIFDNVADQITLGELIASGALVKPRTFVVDIGVREDLARVKRTAADYDMSEVAKILDRHFLNEQIVGKWKEIAGDRQTVIFCSTVEHAQHVTEAFCAAGVSARMVTGEMPDGERRATLAAFDRAEFQVIVNVAVLTEGWDCQPVGCIVLLRPSSFASTMIQMIGRGLRRQDPERYPNRPPKSDCIVIDFGTSLLQHGTLEQDIVLDPQKGDPLKKLCPECDSSVPQGCRECPICGYAFPGMEPGGDSEGGKSSTLPMPDSFVLTEIDLFAASPFEWCQLWDGAVCVATAFEAWAMVICYQGQWYALGGAKEDGVKVLSVGERLLGLSAADDWMREHGDRDGAAKSKRWLHMPATDKQLQALHLPPASGVALSRYQAACHLTWRFNERAVRARLYAASIMRTAA